MMTKTETIVRLLKSALAGTADVSISRNFEATVHQYVHVTIDGTLLIFWKRSELRRIEEAKFPDGVIIDTDVFEAEHWIPPREEFPAWHKMMGGLENASQETLLAAEKTADAELTAARSALEKTDEQHADYVDVYDIFYQRFKNWSDASERFGAYEPYHYLSPNEQDEFEEMLKKL